MKKTKNSDGINPWTWRIKQTAMKSNSSPEEIHFSRNQDVCHKPTNYPNINFKNKLSRNRILPNHINFEEISSQHTSPFKTREKIPSSCKAISLEFQAQGNQQKRRYNCLEFNLKQLKHFTQRMVISIANNRSETVNFGQNQKVLKVKRYFTQEKDYEEQGPQKCNFKNKICKQAEGQFLNRSIEMRKKKLNGIKVVKVKKTSFSREELITSGKLYNQISNIYDSKNNLTGHLSLMKRNYNIKKLQRILKTGSSVPTMGCS